MGQYYQGLGESELGPGDHKHLPPHSVSADAFFVARLMWKGNSYLIFFQTCNIFIDVIAGIYTEETLQPLNKTQIIKLFLKTQEQTNNTINTLTEEIKEIHRSFKKLELEIVVVKKVNDALVKQLSSVERQCWKNAQYSRRECVEVVGIPSSVEHDQLNPTVWRILHHTGVNIFGDKTEACHRLGRNSDRTIVKFSSRKD